MGGLGRALLSAGTLHGQSVQGRAHVARLHGSRRKWVYKLCGINPEQEMNWKQFLKALLMVNLFWFVWGMVLLCCQGWLPLNPDGNPGQTPDLAFNTCISFMVNCNLQHYSGESGLSYFTQLYVSCCFSSLPRLAAWRRWPGS